MTGAGGEYGGSAAGIRQHYDAPDAFWRVVLGPTMTYSAALYEPGDTLDEAQRRKLRWHLERAGGGAGRLLDVGCGWGSLLELAAAGGRLERGVGLTLSEAQYAHVRARAARGVEARLESWAAYRPEAPFDGVVSIGAFEHFAKPTDTVEAKRAVYRDFFERCRSWLRPEGRMTLQTIAFGAMERERASAFMNDVVFPDSDLPTLDDVVAASRGVFELVELRNDRLHYAETFEAWARNLRAGRAAAVEAVGDERVRLFERYLRLASVGYRMGKTYLLRLALRPMGGGWRQASLGAPAAAR